MGWPDDILSKSNDDMLHVPGIVVKGDIEIVVPLP
jgi:hypothetical protein